MKTPEEILKQSSGLSDADFTSHEFSMTAAESVVAMKLYAEQLNKNSVNRGDFMFSFNNRLPDEGREIIYLLGNGIDGIKNCQLVTGRFDTSLGDFSNDETGTFEYVSYWKYL
jgi:hypothetical protein